MQGILSKLNSIRMFDMKAIVSLTKYDKDHKKITYAPELFGRNVWKPKAPFQDNNNQSPGANENVQHVVGNQTPEVGPSGPSLVQEGRSYAGILRGNKVVDEHGSKVVIVDGKGSLYPIHCIGRSIIGCTKEILSVSRIKLTLEENGLSDVGLSYVGGMTYMLTFKDKMMAMGCLDSHVTFFNNIFSEFYLWKGEDIPYNRVVRIIIRGVPFILRENSLFDKIGGQFGKVIQSSSFSWQNDNNSDSSVMVLTNQKSKIDEAVVIKWNNKSLIAWATEAIDVDMQAFGYEEPLNFSDSDDDMSSCSETDQELADNEEIENGEIRSNESPVVMESVINKNPTSEIAGDQADGVQGSPAENRKSQGGEGFPTHQQDSGCNDDMDNQCLHGNSDSTAHVNCNVEVD
ncbi:hypothetical protein Hanom_Chr07g00587541 [Helianthus anomalus]